MHKIKNILRSLIVISFSLVPCMNAYAGTLNPATGDTTGNYIWIVVIVAVVALVAAIISGVASKKKK